MALMIVGTLGLIAVLQDPTSARPPLAAALERDAQATVTGTVRNGQSHEPIAALMVVITDLNRMTRTDSSGRYVFRQIPSGPHHVAVRSFGYVPRTLHAIVPSQGLLEINVVLVPMETRLPTLYVRRAVPVRGLSGVDAASSESGPLTIAAVRNDPRYTEPDLLQSLVGGDVIAQAESPSGLHVRGGATSHVAYQLDGIPVFNP